MSAGCGGGAAARWSIGLGLACAALFAACGHRATPPPPTGGPTVVGMASWYGPGFDGRRTASGEIYNEEQMTAASNVYPLGTRLIVTNLHNGRSATVRVNDRGPFRKGRKVDLSHAAARTLGIVGPGTAKVRMDVLSVPPGVQLTNARIRYFVQLGSFTSRSHAIALRTRLAEYYPDVRIDPLAAGRHRYYRVRMGGFPTRDEAETRAAASARFGLPILVIAE